MKQVRQRTALIILLIALLAAGMALFCIFYFVHGADWASFSANAHAYTDGTLTSGEILDREGVTLYDPATGEYADSRSLRRATLHAVGDPQNNISTGAKTAFRSRLVGFNPLTGTTTGGHKLYLSIDSSLNETARDLLNGRKGSVAVYNYQTGQILCMVSSPDFDPADPPTITDGDSRYDGVYMNRVLSSTFTPGSVFKVVTTAAAIEQLPTSSSAASPAPGAFKIGGDTITCPPRPRDDGLLQRLRQLLQLRLCAARRGARRRDARALRPAPPDCSRATTSAHSHRRGRSTSARTTRRRLVGRRSVRRPAQPVLAHDAHGAAIAGDGSACPSRA